MDDISYIKPLMALIFVLSIMGLIAYLARKFFAEKLSLINNKSEKTMKLLEILPIDARNRLIRFSVRNIEHVILVGVHGNIEIRTDYQSLATEPSETGALCRSN